MGKAFLTKVVFLCLLLSSLSVEAALPRLLVKMATRQRPEQFFHMLDLYYAKISKKIPYHFLISCDLDDSTMNNDEVKKKLAAYPNLTICYGNNKTKIEACNADMDKYPNFDILVLASDDMYPMIDNYDLIIAYWMQMYFPNFDGLLNFQDGGGVTDGLVTYPVMGKNFYHRFGYIYYPEYKSFFCDNEMTCVAWMLNKKAWITSVVLEHRHPALNKAENDELYKRNDKYWKEDEKLYYERLAIDFGLKKSEIVFPIRSFAWEEMQMYPAWRFSHDYRRGD